jgi:hypothetical protein
MLLPKGELLKFQTKYYKTIISEDSHSREEDKQKIPEPSDSYIIREYIHIYKHYTHIKNTRIEETTNLTLFLLTYFYPSTLKYPESYGRKFT